MGRPKKDKVHFTIKIDKELKDKIYEYPNLEKSDLVNTLLWDWVHLNENKKNKKLLYSKPGSLTPTILNEILLDHITKKEHYDKKESQLNQLKDDEPDLFDNAKGKKSLDDINKYQKEIQKQIKELEMALEETITNSK